MKKSFYSNGKLLITGEYVVLSGATAFALPTKYGQFLEVEKGTGNSVAWISYDADGSVWFSGTFLFDEIISGICNPGQHDSVRKTLLEILHEAYLLQPEFLKNSKGFNITTRLTFPRLWGLGTSSTLLNNIAQWLNTDAYKLLENSFGGSGYDIACAQHDTPILYHLENGRPKVTPVAFNPSFKENLYFVYLNQKQNSRAAIAGYFNKQQRIGTTLTKINRLTQSITAAPTVSEFAVLLEEHEALMSDVLEMQTVKEAYFNDFRGVIKSLGAWGGDFVMVVSAEDPTSYFKSKGYPTILHYSEMIK